jgi:UDPglucose 6-dehydrogenase
MLSVIGTGYLGATHAACMAELGFDVIGIDTDATKITLLSQGELPFYEPELDDLLRKHVATGKLRFSTDFAELAHADQGPRGVVGRIPGRVRAKGGGGRVHS